MAVCSVYMEAFEIVEPAIPGFGHDRPSRFAEALRRPFLDAGIDLTDGIGVGDADGALHDAEILQIGLARHLAIAVEIEEAAIDRMRIVAPAREDDGDARAHRPLADLERPLATDQRDLPDLDPRHIGDGVEGAGRALERHAEIAGALGRAASAGAASPIAAASSSEIPQSLFMLSLPCPMDSTPPGAAPGRVRPPGSPRADAVQSFADKPPPPRAGQ